MDQSDKSRLESQSESRKAIKSASDVDRKAPRRLFARSARELLEIRDQPLAPTVPKWSGEDTSEPSRPDANLTSL